MSNFTIIEYTGKAAGPIPFFGKATKTMYRFGGKVRRMAIDSKDVDGLLAIYEGHQPVFRLVNEELPVDDIPDQPEPPTPVTEQTAKAPSDQQPPDEPFDFTVLSGIGPARNLTLHNAGITTQAQFLAADDGQLADWLNANPKAVATWKAALHV